MSVIIEIVVFLIVLVVLILVHEFGHFVVAKLSGMRVYEFGIGFPPRALTIAKIGDTEYTLNWLPFGGFVRIYGEDGVQEDTTGVVSNEVLPTTETSELPKKSRAFTSKNRFIQAITLLAGIVMNVLLAYVLFTITLVLGTPQALTQDQVPYATHEATLIASVNPGSPAAKAGFMAGDELVGATTTLPHFALNYDGAIPEGYSSLIAQDASLTPMRFSVNRNGKILSIVGSPQTHILSDDLTRPAFGFTLTEIGTIKVAPSKAWLQGAQYTWSVTVETLAGFGALIKGLLLFNANLSQVAGPVGIANAVGQATAQGIVALLSLTALISINLAIVNLIPVPALDGGRLLFVIIESITRKKINPTIAARINAIGFALLLLLMAIVTVHDVFNLFH